MTPGSNPSRIGVDIGGTFTDLILVDDATGALTVGKLLTTPDDPSQAVEHGLGDAAPRARGSPAAEDVAHVIHGTTLVTNAVIERKGARTALLTTRGFRDAYEIAREHRYDLYDLFLEMPEPLVPRHLRLEVDERVLADGSVSTPLDAGPGARSSSRELRDKGIEAVAVCFLHSYRQPGPRAARRRDDLREIAARRAGVAVVGGGARRSASTSAPRPPSPTSTCRRWSSAIWTSSSASSRDSASRASCYSCSPRAASRPSRRPAVPVPPARVGPGGGRAGRRALRPASRRVADLLSFDMGGTTAKAVRHRRRPAAARARVRGRSRVPLQEGQRPADQGAGGRADRDRRGRRLDRARRPPGPAQGRARTAPAPTPGRPATAAAAPTPTVTDADLLLGYLDPAFFLGGRMRSTSTRRERAVEADASRDRWG